MLQVQEFNLIQNETLEKKQKYELDFAKKGLNIKDNPKIDDKINLNFINFNEHIKEGEFIMDLSHLNSQQKQ